MTTWPARWLTGAPGPRRGPVCSTAGRAGPHRYGDAPFVGHPAGLFVTSVDVADDAHPGVVREHAGQLLRRQRRTVGHADLAGVDGPANPDAAAVVDGDPRGPAGRVQQRIEQRPVGNGIRPVEHLLGFTVRRGHRTAVEVVAADHDRGFQAPVRHHLVEAQTGPVAFAVAEPADAGRQPLKSDLLAGHRQPAAQTVVVGEQFQHGRICGGYVLRVAGEGGPAKRAFPLAKQRPDVCRDKTRVVKGPLEAAEAGFGPQAVAVVEHLRPLVEQFDQCGAVFGHGRPGLLHVLLGVGHPQLARFRQAHPGRHVAEGVVGRRLVGGNVDGHVPADELGDDLGPVAHQPDGQRAGLETGLFGQGQRLVEVMSNGVEVARLQPALDPARVDVAAEDHASVHSYGQRLGTTHTACAAGHRQRPDQAPVEAFVGYGRKRLVGPLQDPLGADINPAPGRHLAVHGEAEPLEAAELVPVGPFGDEVGIGDEDARRPLVGPEDADGTARLDQERLVVLQGTQRRFDGVKRGPVPRRPPGAPVDHEVVRVFGHFRVEVVMEHP